MPTYTPTQVAQEILRQGGSTQQALVGAALTDGIESSGSTTAKNPSSTACGLFQFLDTTWQANGGSQYSSSACGASFQQQISVFLTASKGNNFYPWKPDVVPGGGYDGVAVFAPVAGSQVANKIAANGTGWLNGASTSSAITNAQTPAGIPQSGNPCNPVISLGPVGTLLDSCQASGLLGGLLMASGGLLMLAGVAVLLANLGITRGPTARIASMATRTINTRSSNRAQGQRSESRMAEREHASGLRIQEAEAKASSRRYGSLFSGRGSSETPAYVPGSAPPFPDE